MTIIAYASTLNVQQIAL